MGGHGGLNILPQKYWNVYNWDNRVKVERDEKLVRQRIEKEEEKRKTRKLDALVNEIKTGRKAVVDFNKANYNEQEIYKEEREKLKREKRAKADITLSNFVEVGGKTKHLFEKEERMANSKVERIEGVAV